MLAGLAAVLAIASCELGTVTVASTQPTIVVHGVLNPSAIDQVILVERTLTGTQNIPDTTFDATDPIVTAGGIPVSDAIVEIIDSAGRVTRGVEARTVSATGKGAGVYRVPLRGDSLVLGARYQLRVRTANEPEVTAFTRIPRTPFRQTGGLSRTFNRDHDVMVVQWPGVPTARSFAVRIESPFGPFFLFTDSSGVRLDGELRNLFSGNLERVFIPGFRQQIFVGAVDSNFYDYYRTNNDPFTGAGIINRVNGGIGLFGSIVSLNTGTISVIADQTEPIEGRFRLTPPINDINTPNLLTLYVESPSARPELPTALSGRYSTGSVGTRVDGLTGRMFETAVTLVFLANQLAGDTIDVWNGQLDGDTLRGSYERSGVEAVFARIR